MDSKSWIAGLYDENQPFIHIEALETFEFLKNKVGTGYYEELIQKYLLDNTHGAIVVVRPETGTYSTSGCTAPGQASEI